MRRKDERQPETRSIITQRDLTQLHREGLRQPCVLHQAAVVVLVTTFDGQRRPGVEGTVAIGAKVTFTRAGGQPVPEESQL